MSEYIFNNAVCLQLVIGYSAGVYQPIFLWVENKLQTG